MNLSFGNRVPSSSKNPHFLNNAKCKTFHAGKSFIFMGLKHHFHNTFYYRGPAEGWHRSQNADGPFFQRYIVRDISLTEIYCWLIEILSAILKRRGMEDSQEKDYSFFGERHVPPTQLVYERKFKSEYLERQIYERSLLRLNLPS